MAKIHRTIHRAHSSHNESGKRGNKIIKLIMKISDTAFDSNRCVYGIRTIFECVSLYWIKVTKLKQFSTSLTIANSF